MLGEVFTVMTYRPAFRMEFALTVCPLERPAAGAQGVLTLIIH